MQRKTYTIQQALERAMKLCSKREYAHNDIRKKLYQWGMTKDEGEEVIALLIEQDFLNEGRFAEAAVKDKFRMNRWGRNKIRHWLKSKGVSDYSIKPAMEEIDEGEYLTLLDEVVQKKWQSTSGNRFKRAASVTRYAVQRGFEPNLVQERVSELVEGH